MRVALLGDIALFGCFSVKKVNDLKLKLRDISEYLSGFDLVVGNLESPFSKEMKTYGAKSAYVCSNEENINVLKWLNVKVVNLANNHMFDYGREGYETTKSLLDTFGIKYFGTEGKIVDFVMKDNRVRFSGYCCYSTNPLMLSKTQGGYGVNKYNVEDVWNAMTSANKDGFLNIISVHAGLEHVNLPSLDHVRAARLLANTCPYVYYGHHPHVIQGVEEYNGSLIAHSLGNFCFDDIYTNASGNKPLVTLTDQNRTGLILELSIESNKVVDWKEQMIHIEQDGQICLIEDDERLALFNNSLVHCEENVSEYMQARMNVLDTRVAERKAMRNFSWVIKRLRPRFVRLILDMMRNSKLYNLNVKKYLSK